MALLLHVSYVNTIFLSQHSAKMKDYEKLHKVIEHLARLLQEGQSGVLLLATDNNESARIGITDGKISQCSFKRLHGTDALDHLQNINAARYSFAKGMAFPFKPNDSLNHEAAIAQLGIHLEEKVKNLCPLEQQETHVSQSKVKIYRGNVIASTDETLVNNPKKSPQKPNKGQRVYRGRIIDTDN